MSEERVARMRKAMVAVLYNMVGGEPSSGAALARYTLMWPHDTAADIKGYVFGIKRTPPDGDIPAQSSCGIAEEHKARAAGFEWPMTWGGKAIADGLKLSYRDRLNSFSPPLYAISMVNEFMRQNGALIDLRQREATYEDIEVLRQQGNYYVCGLRGVAGWAKNTFDGEHIASMVDPGADGTDMVVEGGQPGVHLNERELILNSRGELWVSAVGVKVEADGRPAKGRRICFIGDYGAGTVCDHWRDLSGDVSPTGEEA